MPCEYRHVNKSLLYLVFKSTCLSAYLRKIQPGGLGARFHMERQSWATLICLSVLMAGRWSGSPVHRKHSQGAKEVLPGSRGTWQSPVLLGTHFRSQGEIDYLLGTFPLGLPSTLLGDGAAGRWWWWWRYLKRYFYLYLLKFQVYIIIIQHPYILQSDHPQKSSLVTIHHYAVDPLHLFCPPSAPFPSGNHRSVPYTYEFVFVLFVHYKKRTHLFLKWEVDQI